MTNDPMPVELREKINRYKNDIEQKHGKSIAALREERRKRLYDMFLLRETDRIPVGIQTGVFSCRSTGVPLSSQYYDFYKFCEVCIDTMVELDPDMSGLMLLGSSGIVNDLMQPRTQRWPGGTLPEDVPYQFVEGEYMKADEYDHFFADPSDFTLRVFLPRIYGALEPLSKLPPIRNMVRGGMVGGIFGLLASPEYRELGEKIIKANAEQEKMMQQMMSIMNVDEELGYPSQFGPLGRGGVGGAPFDVVSDFLRGMRGAMIDMYRCPDKLHAMVDQFQEWQFAEATPAVPDEHGNPPRLFMALHRGSDGFMSRKQFEEFYWPGLKKAILKAIELGYIVAPVFEGVWDDKLEYLLELPKGKVTFWGESTDIRHAKEVLGGHMCLQYGMPPTLLQAGSPQDVEEYCKKLIKDIGKDGGFIMFPSSSMDYANPANVKAMVETTKKYGVY